MTDETTPQISRNQVRIFQEIDALTKSVRADILNIVRTVISDNRDELQQRYIAYLSNDNEISAVAITKSHQEELAAGFSNWVSGLMQASEIGRQEFIDREVNIGQMMARIGYPPHAVSRAARKTKVWAIRKFMEIQLSQEDFFEATVYMVALVDLAIELRELTFSSAQARQSRIDEAYKLHSLGQNLGVERERQRALLMEWGHRVLTSFHQGSKTSGLPRLSKSEFGLWINHKARTIFEDSPSLEAVFQCIERIDNELVPVLENSDWGNRQVVSSLSHRIEEEIASIKFELNAIFETHISIEGGRDPLTQLLNRRFMPAVLMREVKMQRMSGDQGFCVLALDIDHFKVVNDTHGHAVGDLALQHVASLVTDNVRPSDFVFRYGGEEIVVVLVDCPLSIGQSVAEKIRTEIERLPVLLQSGAKISLSTSIGVAAYESELDYEVLLSRADAALYEAKRNGRNRVVIAA